MSVLPVPCESLLQYQRIGGKSLQWPLIYQNLTPPILIGTTILEPIPPFYTGSFQLPLFQEPVLPMLFCPLNVCIFQTLEGFSVLGCQIFLLHPDSETQGRDIFCLGESL